MAKPLLLDAATINEIEAEGSQWAESEKRRLAENYVKRNRSVSRDSPKFRAELLRNCIAWVKGNFLEKCLAACDVAADQQLRLLRIADDPASDVFDPYCQETQRAVIRAGKDTLRRLEQLAGRGLPSRSPVAISLKAMADLAAAQWSMRVAKVFDGPNGKRSEFALQSREVRADRLRPLSSIPPSGPPLDASAVVSPKTPDGEQLSRGWTVERAIQMGEEHIGRNEYPGLTALAKLIGNCPKSTMSNAVNRSDKLRAKHADYMAVRASRKNAASLSQANSDTLQQERERSPIEGAALATDDLFHRLIEAATPEQRAKLNGMTRQQRLELVATVGNDPHIDKVSQSLRQKLGFS